MDGWAGVLADLLYSLPGKVLKLTYLQYALLLGRLLDMDGKLKREDRGEM